MWKDVNIQRSCAGPSPRQARFARKLLSSSQFRNPNSTDGRKTRNAAAAAANAQDAGRAARRRSGVIGPERPDPGGRPADPEDPGGRDEERPERQVVAAAQPSRREQADRRDRAEERAGEQREQHAAPAEPEAQRAEQFHVAAAESVFLPRQFAEPA